MNDATQDKDASFYVSTLNKCLASFKKISGFSVLPSDESGKITITAQVGSDIHSALHSEVVHAAFDQLQLIAYGRGLSTPQEVKLGDSIGLQFDSLQDLRRVVEGAQVLETTVNARIRPSNGLAEGRG